MGMVLSFEQHLINTYCKIYHLVILLKRLTKVQRSISLLRRPQGFGGGDGTGGLAVVGGGAFYEPNLVLLGAQWGRHRQQ